MKFKEHLKKKKNSVHECPDNSKKSSRVDVKAHTDAQHNLTCCFLCQHIRQQPSEIQSSENAKYGDVAGFRETIWDRYARASLLFWGVRGLNARWCCSSNTGFITTLQHGVFYQMQWETEWSETTRSNTGEDPLKHKTDPSRRSHAENNVVS